MSSLSQAIVFQVKDLRKHKNADALWCGEKDGLPFIVNGETKDGDWRILVPFDLIPPNEDWIPEFTRGKRVRPMRLRGEFSMAVCLPVPEGIPLEEDLDVTDRLGFTKWEPPELCEPHDGVQLQNSWNGYSTNGPSGLFLPKYDLESLRKYHTELIYDEYVVFTEKTEGENFSIVYWEDRLHVRSRTRWIAEGDNKWWVAARKYNWDWLKDNPGLVAIGEKYGNVNKFRYDCVNGEEKIRLFDIWDSRGGNFLSYDEFRYHVALGDTPTVPILYEGPWQGLEYHRGLAEGRSTFGDNIREGFVVVPRTERYTKRGKRIKYKMPGEEYLIFKGKSK